MPQVFVSATTAQMAAFGARFAIAALVPQIATCLSSLDTPKALLFSFFSNFSNLFALANDVRWKQNASQTGKQDSSLKLGTLAMALLATAVAASVLLTDIALFQFSARTTGYKLAPTKFSATFQDDTVDLGGHDYEYPAVMLSPSASNDLFKDAVYVSNDGVKYMNYGTHQDGAVTVSGPEGKISLGDMTEDGEFVKFEGPFGEVKAPGKNTGVPRCTVMSRLAADGSEDNQPTRLHCMIGDEYSKLKVDSEETLTVGFNGDKLVYFYQTTEGANYLFLELVHRDYYNLGGLDTNSTAKLEASLDELSRDSYVTENVLINGEPVDLSENKKSNMDFVKAGAASAKGSYFQVQLLMSKNTLSYKFGVYPVYTKDYVLWSAQGNRHLIDGGAHGSYTSLNYKSRQALVEGKKIRSNLLGVSTDGFVGAPVSAKISTHLTDDEVILSTLENPATPLMATELDLFNIFPSLVFSSACFLVFLCLVIFQYSYRKNSTSRTPFFIDLEIYHHMFDKLNGYETNNLPCKMESGSRDLVMTKGISLLSNEYVVGLAEKRNIHSVEQMNRSKETKPSSAVDTDSMPLLERGSYNELED